VQNKLSMLLAAAFIYFFIISVILGMILKIMPFLSYTQLQQRCLSDFSMMQHLPNMHDFISKKQGGNLLIFHLLTGCLLIATIMQPYLHSLLAIGLLLEFSWLLWLMIKTCTVYSQASKKMSAVNHAKN